MTTNINITKVNTNITPPAQQTVTIGLAQGISVQGIPGVQGIRGESMITYASSGPLSVRAGKSRYRFPFNATINGVSAAIDTPSSGSSIIIDVNLDGASLFTNPVDRLTIPAGNNTAAEIVTTRTTSINTGQYVTVDIDQVGSVNPGSDLTVFLRYTPI